MNVCGGEEESETVDERYYRGIVHKERGAAQPGTTGETDAIPDADESSAEDTKTSFPKAASTKAPTEADAAGTSVAEEERQSETYASKTTSETITASFTKSRASESPTPKEVSQATETTAGSRTRRSHTTRAILDKDAEKTPVKGMLLCTAGDFAVEEDMFPTDGLCDLLFYTHVRFRGGDFRGRYNEKSWKTFRRLAPASRKTGFGMSISYRRLPITLLVVRTHIHRRVGSVPVVGTLVDKLEGARGKSMNVPTLTCKNNATFDIVGDATLRYEGIREKEVFCFEDTVTIAQKVRRVNLDYKVTRSWAVFDAEFEDYKNVCGKGPFQRISELKQLLQKFS
ncbi:hypothetical protein HPB50_024264 [Hyalomma asiaticum]|uniref:Uncharacterized protein n=1 Tax=Hyalomma asiaticum TaxID=266040 RepID=A0ACB7SE22_HYAAI|nr:hypothetical protein HPB50_024264 [Hyalomma asiaticum]